MKITWGFNISYWTTLTSDTGTNSPYLLISLDLTSNQLYQTWWMINASKKAVLIAYWMRNMEVCRILIFVTIFTSRTPLTLLHLFCHCLCPHPSRAAPYLTCMVYKAWHYFHNYILPKKNHFQWKNHFPWMKSSSNFATVMPSFSHFCIFCFNSSSPVPSLPFLFLMIALRRQNPYLKQISSARQIDINTAWSCN